ncbi:hypothetical protein DY000_02058187 [Brassica cretica]|uniref:Uncharacterized protein n=1 Tax=Brassica cretica TaxID=69181 RepID=A0ABQ7A6A8_BRACR|nr:hypothetical protein DY000_02058187 [Brassica cretica]
MLYLADEDKLFLLSVEEDDADQCIRLLSFCKRHRQISNKHLETEYMIRPVHNTAKYVPPPNPSGCARTEPCNYFGRRGGKEPEALAGILLVDTLDMNFQRNMDQRCLG